MKVTVSVLGRFWAFNLADQLHKRGYLRRLITTYPKFETIKYGIPRSHIVSHFPVELVSRLAQRMPSPVKRHYNPQFVVAELADRCSAMRIPHDSDIFVGHSSTALHSLRRARKLGAVTLVERGSTHMVYQTEILTEEFTRLGLRPLVAHPRVVEKELQEYEEADYIVVPSEFVKHTFLEKGVSEKKLVQVPFGVSVAEFMPIPKEDKVFRVIHTGTLSVRKGVHYLLQAFVEADLPNSELWLIGPMFPEIQPFLRKYDNGRIFHKGRYPQGELHRFYSQGSVFCLASIEEGLAMVIPQAMACGLPVICTTNTGGSDVVREGKDGFIVAIRDVDSLKAKLEFLYEHPELRKTMGESAREHIIGGFTWDHYGDRCVARYAELLENRALCGH